MTPRNHGGGRPRSRLTWPLRLDAARYRFRESLFQLPALIVLGGMILAELTVAVDEAVDGSPPLTLNMNSNAATWLLSTVAGATITTAGVVFSLTVVSLQLASSQFSPRVMRSFIRDRLSQVVIGLLVATFVFSVLALRHVGRDETSPAPPVTMTVAVVLAVTTVLLIIAHLDHLAARLQVGQVVRSIFREGETTIDQLRGRVAQETPVEVEAGNRGEGMSVTATIDGWVAQASGDLILASVPPGTVVRLETRTGAYIHRDEPLLTLWLPSGADAARAAARIRATVQVAEVRTMQQDVDFALRQLVDVGLRALSPAVNDPTTAVEAVLRVGGLMRLLLLVDLPAAAVRGREDRVLLRPWELTHDEYVAHAFDQLRQSAGAQTQVLAALLRVLRMLRALVQQEGRPERVPALERQLDLVLATVRALPELLPADREWLLALADDSTDPADHTPGRGEGRRDR